MKFTDENIEKAFENARQDLFDRNQCQNKKATEVLLDEGLIHQLDNLVSAKDLLQQLIDFDDMDWVKGKRELSDHEMINFIVAVSYSEAVSFWCPTIS